MPEMIDVPVPGDRAAEEKNNKFHSGGEARSPFPFVKRDAVPGASTDRFLSATVDKIDGDGDFPRPERDAPTAGRREIVLGWCVLRQLELFETAPLKLNLYNYL